MTRASSLRRALACSAARRCSASAIACSASGGADTPPRGGGNGSGGNGNGGASGSSADRRHWRHERRRGSEQHRHRHSAQELRHLCARPAAIAPAHARRAAAHARRHFPASEGQMDGLDRRSRIRAWASTTTRPCSRWAGRSPANCWTPRAPWPPPWSPTTCCRKCCRVPEHAQSCLRTDLPRPIRATSVPQAADPSGSRSLPCRSSTRGSPLPISRARCAG